MTTLRHDLSGPDGAPVLVLGNSMGTTTQVWDAHVPALRRHFRVLRYELPGHGGSPAPPGPYTMAGLAGDVRDLLDGLGVARAAYAGVSLGGMIGMWLAAHEPARVTRLAVCCSSAYLGAAAYTERARLVRDRGTAAVVDGVLGRWFTPAYRDREPAVVARYGASLAAVSAEGYAGCCEAIAAMDLRPDLPAITAPTLVIAGADDPATPPSHGEVIVAAVPGARLVVVPGAHLAAVESPGEVTAALLDHLVTAPRPAGRTG